MLLSTVLGVIALSCFVGICCGLFDDIEENRWIVLVVSRLGFANRVRAIADWHLLALQSGRSLVVSWEPTVDCNSTFFDLFQGGPPKFKVLPFALPAPTAFQTIGDMATEFGLTHAILTEDASSATLPAHEASARRELAMFAGNNSSFVISKAVLLSDINVLVTNYVGVTILEDLSCQSYLHKHSEFLRSLVPNDNAATAVAEIKRAYFSDRTMIGIHVRVHDPLQDWAVVPPLYSLDSSRAVNFGVGATVEHFLYYMQHIERALSKQIRFFIASNDPAVKEELLSHFPDAITINGDERDLSQSRATTKGIQFAFIEWLLLSEAALVLNTHGSSFAVEASQVHQRPLASIYGGKILHLYNQYLPYCAHLLYMRTYAQQGLDEEYVENDGASFQRSIVGRHIWMSACDYLSDWGLSGDLGVYCVNTDSDAAAAAPTSPTSSGVN